MSKLFIINYGVDMTADKLSDTIKEEDERLMKAGRETVDRLGMGKGALMVSEVLHTGVPTNNHWRYMQQGLSDAVGSFYKQSLTPFLMHHNDGANDLAVNSAIAIGSNVYAENIIRDVVHPAGNAQGYVKVVTFIPKDSMVGNEKALDLIQSRRLMALSVGATVASHNFLCSICGKSVRSSDCEHSPGRVYDGRKMIIDIYNPRFIEYSAVYDPADIVATIRRVDLCDSSGSSTENETIVDQNPYPLHLSFFDSKKVFASASIPQETTSMDLNDILKLESQGKLRDAILAMGTELKHRDEIIGTLSDTVVSLTKTKDSVTASAAVSDPAPAKVEPETPPATDPAPETPPAVNPDVEALKRENEELKAKLAAQSETSTPETPPVTDPAPETPPASDPVPPATDTAPSTEPVPPVVPESTEPTKTGDAAKTSGSDVKKPVSIGALLRGRSSNDMKTGTRSVHLNKYLS